ncbi:MAG: hypothetical protein N3C12_01245 [Candidatus Binatia bacterium]|nr:hypothetical protein [Candidatus Binatia bacterium]
MGQKPRHTPVSLSTFTIEELLRRGTTLNHGPTVHLKIPVELLREAHELAEQLGVTRTALVTALLNEGLLELTRRRGANL